MVDWYVFELRNSIVYENDWIGLVKKKIINNKLKKLYMIFKVV